MEATCKSGSATSNLTGRVCQALDELLPAMIADGGGAEFVSLENGVATLRLVGSCNFCPSRQLSAAALRGGIQQRIPELVAINIIYPSLPSLCQQLALVEKL
jgi:Fe-S cluster biogenesis protein NfuA